MKKRFGDQRKKEIDAIAASAKRGNSLGKDLSLIHIWSMWISAAV